MAVGPVEAKGRAPGMDDEGDALAHIQGVEQGVEVAAMLDEAIRTGATVRQLVGVAHADQVRGDAAALWLQVRQHVAPEVRRGWVAVQQHDGVAISHIDVRHLAVEDPPPLLSIRKCRRDHVRFSFFVEAEYLLRPSRKPWTPVVAAAIALSNNRDEALIFRRP